jgi:hypothetical protein
MFLNETYTEWVGKRLCDFPIKNAQEQGDALLSLLFNFAQNMSLGNLGTGGGTRN